MMYSNVDNDLISDGELIRRTIQELTCNERSNYEMQMQ